MASSAAQIPPFDVLNASKEHGFEVPSKRINEGGDLAAFHVSHAYRDILAFIMHLNRSMFPTLAADGHPGPTKVVEAFSLDTFSITAPAVLSLQSLLKDLDQLIQQAPPDPGPRRFGNISFRKWHQIVEGQCPELLHKHLPSSVIEFKRNGSTSALDEAGLYLLGSFGSQQRLDYGTGHELSFLAFVGCIYKLGGFGDHPSPDVLRQIVIGVVQPYLDLVRKLILTYTLEPAGTHGVWGLDDHSFAPYIFGSAQLGPAVRADAPTPTEGSVKGAPDPGKIVSKEVVETQRAKNMYFSAIGFINDVKNGPFWEHSPTLYDISGVRAGWGKINKGMLKMYDAEVLGKFPVVQHFPFGSLFTFDADPDAKAPVANVHTQNQPPTQRQMITNPTTTAPLVETTRAPWAAPSVNASAALPNVRPNPNMARPGAPSSVPSGTPSRSNPASAPSGMMPPPTKAPWAK